MQRTRCRIRIRQERIAGQLVVGFRKSGFAKCAFPALNASFAEGTSFHADRVPASDTCHGLFSACVEREKPYNQFGSRVRLTPRSGLAPQPVSAGSGALIVSYVLGWWFDRDFYGMTGSECDLDADRHAGFILPESPVKAGLSHLTPQSTYVYGHNFRGPFRPNPSISGLTSNGAIFAHLILLDKPLYHGDDRCLQITVSARVEASTLHDFG